MRLTLIAAVLIFADVEVTEARAVNNHNKRITRRIRHTTAETSGI
jgi:hypothetical protein